MFTIILIYVVLSVLVSYILSNGTGGGIGFFDIFKFVMSIGLIICIIAIVVYSAVS